MASISPDAGEHSPISPLSEYYDDIEPDEAWKLERMEIIEDSFKGMIQEAKARLERKIQSIQGLGDADEEERERAMFVEEFQGEAAAMKTLAKEEFEHALARERMQRRLRRDLPIRATINHHQSPTINHQSLRLNLEQEQAATLKAATLEGGALENGADVEAAFQNLLNPSSADDRPSPSPDSEEGPELKEVDMGKAGIRPDAGALTIKITRLPAEPAVNGNVGWVKASDAAREYEMAVRQRANSKTEVARIAAPPAPPAKKWVSASDAARRKSQGA